MKAKTLIAVLKDQADQVLDHIPPGAAPAQPPVPPTMHIKVAPISKRRFRRRHQVVTAIPH